MGFELTVEGCRIWKWRLEKGELQVEEGKQDQENVEECEMYRVGEKWDTG